MFDELTAVEESVTKVLFELMIERVMPERGLSTGVQESSMRVLPTSPSTARGAGPSRPLDEKRTKNRDDLVNSNSIMSILPTYLPPLSGAINRDSVPKVFEYALVTGYLPKGICTIHVEQDKIAVLKFSNFNLGVRKVYSILDPHKYLTRTKGKNSKIIPQ
jgi:hypothetical protein